MTSKEIIRAALAKAEISQTQLSEMLHYSNKTAVGAILNKNSTIRADIFCKWLDALGFEVVIRRKGKKNGAEWIMTVESENEPS